MKPSQERINQILLQQIDEQKDYNNSIFEALIEQINKQQEQIDKLNAIVFDLPWEV